VLAVFRLQQRVERGETRRPQGALCRDPVRDGIERPRIERQDVLSPARRRRTNRARSRMRNVLRDRIERDRERFRERSHPRLALRQTPQDGAARRIGERVRALSSWAWSSCATAAIFIHPIG